FDENFEPYLPLGVPRSDSDFTTEEEKAFNLYNNGNYEAAISLFEDVLTQQDKTEILFFLGNAYLASKPPKPKQAISALQKFLEEDRLLNSQANLYLSQAKWYLSLAYLKNNQLDEAKRLLYELKQSESSYSKKANNLLIELDL